SRKGCLEALTRTRPSAKLASKYPRRPRGPAVGVTAIITTLVSAAEALGRFVVSNITPPPDCQWRARSTIPVRAARECRDSELRFGRAFEVSMSITLIVIDHGAE